MSDSEFIDILRDMMFGLNGGDPEDKSLIMVPTFRKTDGTLDRRKTVAKILELYV